MISKGRKYEMKIKDGLEQEYAKHKNINQDTYGGRVVSYGEDWANLMEDRIANGEQLEDIADETSHEADTDDITGFMYSCAASSLAYYWEHGEQLRRWHNLENQIGTEGEEANEKGTVLNTAILNIGTKE